MLLISVFLNIRHRLSYGFRLNVFLISIRCEKNDFLISGCPNFSNSPEFLLIDLDTTENFESCSKTQRQNFYFKLNYYVPEDPAFSTRGRSIFKCKFLCIGSTYRRNQYRFKIFNQSSIKLSPILH